MMAAPITNLSSDRAMERRIHVKGELVSQPYVEMTASVMKQFGVQVDLIQKPRSNESMSLRITAATYQGRSYAIEPDASAASYFWAAAAITGGRIRVEGLSRRAMQGDVDFCRVLESMGCQVDYQDGAITVSGRADHGIDVDMNAISDTVQTLSVVALFAQGPTRVRGVAHNRFKETDRIGNLATELRKLGSRVEEHEDGLTIHPVTVGEFRGARLATYNDHRMAMSFALAGLRLDGVVITDPGCTAKTYPEFFADLEALIGRAHKWA
jgi:3-phosphoshikimate 1-carboxyvinyltransferase